MKFKVGDKVNTVNPTGKGVIIHAQDDFNSDPVPYKVKFDKRTHGILGEWFRESELLLAMNIQSKLK